MPDDTFEPRDITIAHQHLWESLQQWAATRGMELVMVMPADNDHLTSYAFFPRATPKPPPDSGMMPA